MTGEFDNAVPEDAWRVEVPDLREIRILMPENVYMYMYSRSRALGVKSVSEYLRLLTAIDKAGHIPREVWDARDIPS